MSTQTISQGSVVRGPMLREAVEVAMAMELGSALRLVGRGIETNAFVDVTLTAEQVALLSISGDRPAFDGDAAIFRQGVEAQRLGLAYEYDPYFSLSIARVDPLPHQLEAVYHYFLKLPRIRFLLADDPGAGKTIMAGLLLKELKARGLVKRTLIVTPANLTFQWQREMQDKFRETFTILNSGQLRSNYGQNPWQDKNQVVTSVSWVSTVDDARESLLRSPRWDLIIVDEAHKMAAYGDRTTLAFDLGAKLSELTDHFLLMTATPHKGDPVNFCRFLSLLDKDVYGDVSSLEDAMKRNEAPFYLRRTKEALVTFPDPATGKASKLFTKRDVRTADFKLDGDELEFYDDLTHYVEDQSIRAAMEDATRGRAVGFTMAMLQRRMASTVYAVRRTLERMQDKRQKILDDPEAYRRQQLEKAAFREHDDFDDLSEHQQAEILDEMESIVASVDPASLRDEIARLKRLVDKAKSLENREAETKLQRLRELLKSEGVFADKKMKLLVFTEHKDSLDFLAGDGKDGRPLGKLRQWGLEVTTIHGGMKIGDRDTPGTRIHAERDFKENVQVLVATEAAGEGINLQFCWLLVNYDIPWNPVRLEQRLGRIHRYGQEKNCLIFNFVATNTREGRVLQKLHDRLRAIRDELGTEHVFDVVGEVLPATTIDRWFREMYLQRLTEDAVKSRILDEIDVERFRRITESRIEMLAKRELNLGAIVGRTMEAKDARLVPEAIENFFMETAPLSDVKVKPTGDERVCRIGRLPRPLVAIGERLEPRFGKLGREYGRATFDKETLKRDGTLEWITPGHPLFEVVREDTIARAAEHLEKGAVFWDLHRRDPALLDVYAASIKDGSGRTLHRRLYVVETAQNGEMSVRQPTVLHDVMPAPAGTAMPDLPVPSAETVRAFLHSTTLQPWCDKIAGERHHELALVERHVEISLNALLDGHQTALNEYVARHENQGRDLSQDIKVRELDLHIDELTRRLEQRRKDLKLQRNVLVADVRLLGRAWVLPHPEREAPIFKPMVRDEEIERLAIQFAIKHEEAQGFEVESVESENRGYDLISRKRHPEDPKTFAQVKFIEVKGRSGVGDVALTTNEFRTAERLASDYWLYVVFNCGGSQPQLTAIANPARLHWHAVTKVEHYRLAAQSIAKEALAGESARQQAGRPGAEQTCPRCGSPSPTFQVPIPPDRTEVRCAECRNLDGLLPRNNA